MVVEREVARGQVPDAGALLHGAAPGAQRGGGAQQLLSPERPAQKASSAVLSSRRGPMRG
jgi:hypothetical protein